MATRSGGKNSSKAPRLTIDIPPSSDLGEQYEQRLRLSSHLVSRFFIFSSFWPKSTFSFRKLNISYCWIHKVDVGGLLARTRRSNIFEHLSRWPRQHGRVCSSAWRTTRSTWSRTCLIGQCFGEITFVILRMDKWFSILVINSEPKLPHQLQNVKIDVKGWHQDLQKSLPK